MLPSAMLRAAEQAPLESYTSPFRAKKAWPPDLDKLSRIEQFRLERRYRRRTKLKWARPGWTKGVKIAQVATITFVTVYGVLFLDWKQENPPFQGIRKAFDNLTGNMWTLSRENIQKQQASNLDTSPVSPGATAK